MFMQSSGGVSAKAGGVHIVVTYLNVLAMYVPIQHTCMKRTRLL